jgi:hypothetical protein
MLEYVGFALFVIGLCYVGLKELKLYSAHEGHLRFNHTALAIPVFYPAPLRSFRIGTGIKIHNLSIAPRLTRKRSRAVQSLSKLSSPT